MLEKLFKQQKTKLSASNNHLLNIYSEGYFLELGTIGIRNLNRLIKGKSVPFYKIIYENITLKGIGSTTIDDEHYRRCFPLIYFKNVLEKDRTLETFVTYGLIDFYDNGEHKFSPLVLIPVVIEEFDGEYYLKRDGEIIVNELLLTKLNKMGVKLPPNFRVNSLFKMDNFCHYFAKNFRLKFDSFLTFAKIEEKSVLIDHNRFIIKTRLDEAFGNRVVSENKRLLQTGELNFEQRLALEKISDLNSFAVEGIKGTGKSTTLLMAALARAIKGEKVLYLSNNHQTIVNLKKEMAYMGLSGWYFDFLNPMERRQNQDVSYLEETPDEKKLLKLYENVQTFENSYSKRVQSVRMIDALTNLILGKTDLKTFDLDDVTLLSKYEFNQALISLSRIQNTWDLMVSLKDSKFSKMNNSENEFTFDEVMNLLKKLKDSILKLQNIENKLSDGFDLGKINNIFSFKRMAFAYTTLKDIVIPRTWIDVNMLGIKKTKNILVNLIDDIEDIKEQQEELTSDYEMNNFCEPDVLISKLLGNVFDYGDEEQIDLVLKDQKFLYNLIDVIDRSITNFHEATKELSEILNLRLTDNISEEVLDLTELFLVSAGKFRMEEDLSVIFENPIKIAVLETRLDDLEEKLENVENFEEIYSEKFSQKPNEQTVLTDLKEARELNKITEEEYNYLVFESKEFQRKSELTSDYFHLTESRFQTRGIYSKEIKKLEAFFNKENKSLLEEAFSKLIFKTKTYEKEKPIAVEFLNSYNTIITQFSAFTNYVPFKGETIEEKIVASKNFITYIKGVEESVKSFGKILKRPETVLTFQDFLKFKKTVDRINFVNDSFLKNEHYPKYLGSLFTGIDTDTDNIKKIISEFEIFVASFKTVKDAVEWILKGDLALGDYLVNANEVVDDIYSNFKNYNHLFNDSILKFYYDSYSDLITWLDDLLNSEEELKKYLVVNRELYLLKTLRLYKLIEHVKNGFDPDLIPYFTKKYYEFVAIDLNDNKLLAVNKEKLLKTLKAIKEEEEKIFTKNLKQLVKEPINFMYDDNTSVVKQSVKAQAKIFFADTKFLNKHLNIDEYSLVLIDNAHLLSADDYYLALKGRQVVVAGEGIETVKANASLMSRMRSENTIKFKYRYLNTPLGISSFNQQLITPFLETIQDNQGISVRYDKLEKVLSEIIENDNVSINIFTPSLSRKRKIIEFIIDTFKNKMSTSRIDKLISEHINISDLFAFHSIESDYNIIDLEEYKGVLGENYLNALSILMIAEREVIILDEKKELTKEKLSPFFTSIKKIANHEYPLFSEVTNKILLKAFPVFNAHGYHIEGKYHDLSLVVSKNGRYYGLLLFFDDTTSHFNLLSDYRYYYNIFSLQMPISILLLNDLYKDFNKAILDVIKEWEDED